MQREFKITRDNKGTYIFTGWEDFAASEYRDLQFIFARMAYGSEMNMQLESQLLKEENLFKGVKYVK